MPATTLKIPQHIAPGSIAEIITLRRLLREARMILTEASTRCAAGLDLEHQSRITAEAIDDAVATLDLAPTLVTCEVTP